MEKIISLFQRNYDGDRLVRDEIVPGAQWVCAGEGRATVKYDGTCCMVRAGRLYKRYEVAKGKTPPPHFDAASPPDPITGKQQGWVPVGDGPDDRWHREAFGRDLNWPDGTYELLGPKVQGNPHYVDRHILIPHGTDALHDAPRDYAGLKAYFTTHEIEGIVWWHEDGRRVKVKRRDFGLPWPPKSGAIIDA